MTTETYTSSESNIHDDTTKCNILWLYFSDTLHKDSDEDEEDLVDILTTAGIIIIAIILLGLVSKSILWLYSIRTEEGGLPQQESDNTKM